jgi:hypothetical protein
MVGWLWRNAIFFTTDQVGKIMTKMRVVLQEDN